MRPSAYHSIRKLLAVGTAIVAMGVLAPLALAGSQKPFHLEKVCEGTQCVVTASNFAAIPAGSVINYTGPDADHLVPVLTIRNGSTTGQCAIGSIFGTPSMPGHCLLSAGTGRLTQFHLDAAVTFDGTLWYWDGWYWFGN
jgi:hypothetical protein